jgi:hypothetical protein
MSNERRKRKETKFQAAIRRRCAMARQELQPSRETPSAFATRRPDKRSRLLGAEPWTISERIGCVEIRTSAERTSTKFDPVRPSSTKNSKGEGGRTCQQYGTGSWGKRAGSGDRRPTSGVRPSPGKSNLVKPICVIGPGKSDQIKAGQSAEPPSWNYGAPRGRGSREDCGGTWLLGEDDLRYFKVFFQREEYAE